jgi:2-dehydro-3-deoxyglucarate aldolase/4-hydroxy-2-oxoheptanedioate aldolase
MARLSAPELQRVLRSSLKQGKSLGTFVGIPSSIPYELASLAGFDWVIADLEHGENEFSDLASAVVSFDGPVIARVSSASSENISKALDRGAAGIMVPKVSSSQELIEALERLDYPPIGTRGVASYNRSGSWGHDKSALANAEPVAIIQVETRFAVESIDEFTSKPRVDALFIGPLDLSYSLGVPRDFESEIFKDAVAKVLDHCKKAGKPVGILATSAEVGQNYLKQGFDFLAVGSDSTSLLQTFNSQISQLRNL